MGRIGSRIVILEFGAGRAIPSVRRLTEAVVGSHGATLIRVNPRESEVPASQIAIPAGALETLRAIDARLGDAVA